MDKKNILMHGVIILVIAALYLLSGTFVSASDKTEEDVAARRNMEAEETQPQTNTQGTELHDETTVITYSFKRLDATEPDPDKTLPRDKYGLDMPKTERSKSFLAAVMPATEALGWMDFDNAVFIGDFITVGLQSYVESRRSEDPLYMGSARFIAVSNYSVADAVAPGGEESIHRYFNGVRTPPQKICADYEARQIYICLGLNDIGVRDVEEFITDYGTLTDNLLDECPDADIIIQTVTPITLYGEKRALNNAKIDEYNEALALFCADRGFYLADIADVMKDTEGYLAGELSSDDYCHLNDAAYARWVDYLKNHGVRKQ